MAITHTYTYKTFDPVNATVTVQGTSTDSATSTTLAFTRVIPLPVDSAGNVPAGGALTVYINNFLDSLLTADLTRKAILSAHGGVVANASALYAITTDVEPGEGPVGIPVTLYPDNAFRNVVTQEVTQSILVVTGGVGYIDNGNISNPANLTFIVSAGFPDMPGPVIINEDGNWPDVTTEFAQGYNPYGFNGSTDLTIYYIKHNPIRMYNSATAYFNYN